MTRSGLIQRYRRWRLARRGLQLDRSCFVDRYVSLGPRPPVHSPGAIEVGPECELGLGVELNPWDGWLGAGVKVMGGVTIGDGCVVGAGAVVTDDLAPYSIAVGVPAKVIGQRS